MNTYEEDYVSEVSFSIVVEANEYYRKLVDQENISIQAVCVLAPAFGSKNVEFMKTHVLTFQRPDLDVVVCTLDLISIQFFLVFTQT